MHAIINSHNSIMKKTVNTVNKIISRLTTPLHYPSELQLLSLLALCLTFKLEISVISTGSIGGMLLNNNAF